MNHKLNNKIIFIILLIMLPLFQISSQDLPEAPEGWNVELKLLPLGDDHNKDLVHLVPKQSIMMKASVWFPEDRTWIVDYPDWDMPGAGIEKLNTPLANLEREFEGRKQYGHTQNYILSPVDLGTLELRQKNLDISANKGGVELVPIEGNPRIQVDLPPGFYSIDQFLPAYDLDVKQEFFFYNSIDSAKEIEIEEVAELTLSKGDMLERRITIIARGVRGSSIPVVYTIDESMTSPIESHSQDVMGLFGFEGGKRVDSLYYTPDRAGPVLLEDIEIKWWHLKEEQSKTVKLPGVSLNSMAVEAYEEAIGLSWWDKYSSSIIKGLLVTGVLIMVLLMVYLIIRFLFTGLWLRLKEGLALAFRGDSLLFMKLCFYLLIGARNQGKSCFIRWQYQHKIRSVPDEISSYFYKDNDSAAPNLSGSTPGALQILLPLLRWRKKVTGKGRRQDKYGLPEL